MKIEIDQDDFGTLCVCALRYCHGRRTYMPRLVQEIVSNHFENLRTKDLVVIRNDETFQREISLWGDDCDKRDWERFYEVLDKYMAQR